MLVHGFFAGDDDDDDNGTSRPTVLHALQAAGGLTTSTQGAQAGNHPNTPTCSKVRRPGEMVVESTTYHYNTTTSYHYNTILSYNYITKYNH